MIGERRYEVKRLTNELKFEVWSMVTIARNLRGFANVSLDNLNIKVSINNFIERGLIGVKLNSNFGDFIISCKKKCTRTNVKIVLIAT